MLFPISRPLPPLLLGTAVVSRPRIRRPTSEVEEFVQANKNTRLSVELRVFFSVGCWVLGVEVFQADGSYYDYEKRDSLYNMYIGAILWVTSGVLYHVPNFCRLGSVSVSLASGKRQCNSCSMGCSAFEGLFGMFGQRFTISLL